MTRKSGKTIHMLLKFYARVQEIHRSDQQKCINLHQSDSLPIMCILPLQRGWFVHFGLVGSHNQLCTSHTLINLVYIHAQHLIIKAARWEKKWCAAVCHHQCHGQLGARSCRDVTSALCRSQKKPIKGNQKHGTWKGIHQHFSPKTANLQSVGKVCLSKQQMFTMSPWSVLKIHGDIAKLY